MEKKPVVEKNDIFIALSVGVCLLLSLIIPHMQVVTACISILLCYQGGPQPSFKAGVIRLIITAIGAGLGALVVLLDETVGIVAVTYAAVAIGVFLTMVLCKVAKVPPFSARIGAVSFVLVVLALSGEVRFTYAMYRFISTIYGAAIAVAVSFVVSLFNKKPKKESAEG